MLHRHPIRAALASLRYAALAVALLMLCAAPVHAQFNSQGQPLLEAIEAGHLRATGHCPTPRLLSLELVNLTDRKLRLTLETILAAVPVDREAAAARDEKPETPDLQSYRQLVREVVHAQAGLVGGWSSRGGFGGRRELVLEPHQKLELLLPFLATRLATFRPSPSASYHLAGTAALAGEVRLQLLLAELASGMTSHPVAQAAWWHFDAGLSLRQLRLLKYQEFNDAELALCEDLVSEIERCARQPDAAPAGIPARIYMQVINKAGNADQPVQLTRDIKKLTDTAGFLGLPVEHQDIEDAVLETPAQIAMAIGCQLSLGGPLNDMHARVLITRWDGLQSAPHRECRVWLGASPKPRQAVSMIEAGVLKSLIELKQANVEAATTAPLVEVHNHSPLALHSLRLRRKPDSTAATREITLAGYAIGPGRKLEIDVATPAWKLEVIGAAWGR